MSTAADPIATVHPPGPDEYPCPACGFLTFSQPAGSYELCAVCDWEDDGVQLANPTSRGGANAESLAEAQIALTTRLPCGLRQIEGIERDWLWRRLCARELTAANETTVGAHWPNAATTHYYWRHSHLGWDTIATMPDFYDGPRSGLTVFRGSLYQYESTWNDIADAYDDIFVLKPIDTPTACLALEAWFIWLRWERAFYAGEVDTSTHPALPAEAERCRVLDAALIERMPAAEVPGVRASGEFSSATRPAGLLGWVGSAARWRVEED